MLLSLEVIVSNEAGKKTGGDNQKEDWKCSWVSNDKVVKMVHDKSLRWFDSDTSIYQKLLRRNNFVVGSSRYKTR